MSADEVEGNRREDDLKVFLDRRPAACEIIDLGTPMKTADAAATQLGVAVGNIFKSLVLKNDGGAVAVVVMAGDARVDFKAVARALGWKKASFASPDVVLETTGYAAGGTPPIGHRRELPVIVDEGLLAMGEGYAGGGRPELLLKIHPAEIVRVANATVSKVSK